MELHKLACRLNVRMNHLKNLEHVSHEYLDDIIVKVLNVIKDDP